MLSKIPKKQKITLGLSLLIYFVPTFTLAFSLAGAGTFNNFILYILTSIIAPLIPLLFATAFLVFFWGVSKFIIKSNSQADIEKGRNYMLWGILALFILLSFRAIIAFISTDLEFGTPIISNALLPT